MHHDTVVADLPMHDEVNAVSAATNSAMNSLMALDPLPRASWDVRYLAFSVKQLAISSGSGLDHSAQNLVTTSSGERIMLDGNAPAQNDISSPRRNPGVPRGAAQEHGGQRR